MEKTDGAKCLLSKSTYFDSGHVLNSKVVSGPCEQFCFCYKLDPKHDRNFIKHNLKLYIRVQTRNAHTCPNRRYVYYNLTNKHGKIHIKLSHNCRV